MSASPNLQLPYLDANQNQKSVTHNQALRLLDALVNIGVEASGLKAPPAAPADGQRWIVAPGATGAWAGRDLNIAAWQDGAWSFLAPGRGTLAYDAAGATLLFWSGTAWRSIASLLALLGVTALGIGTAADAANPLSATLNNALFNALSAGAGGSGDVRIKLNKAAPGNTASFLFQDGFSGRAEIGLAGDDSFHVKVSPDGSAFVDAMVVATTGAVAFAAPPTAPTPAAGDNGTRLATTGFVAAAVAALVAAAPGALDTLKELADALGDDPNFATTVLAGMAAKAPLASPALTGAPTAPTPALNDNGTRLATTAFVAGALDPLSVSPVAPTLDYRLTAPDGVAAGQFTRLSTATRTTPAGLLVPAASGVRRIDADPVTGATLGTLIEEQRTNLLLSSAAPSLDGSLATGWADLGNLAYATDGTPAPDGSAAQIVSVKSGGDTIVYQQVAYTTAGSALTASGMFKAKSAAFVSLGFYFGTANASTYGVVRLSDGTYTTSGSVQPTAVTVRALGNGWWRVAVTAAVPSGTTATRLDIRVYDTPTQVAAVGNGFYVANLQLEAGAFPTSPIATTTAQATRAADSLVVPVTSDWFNPREGTLFVDATVSALPPGAGYQGLVSFDDASSSGVLGLYYTNSSFRFQSGVATKGYPEATTGALSLTPGQRVRVAGSYTASSVAISANGSPPDAATMSGIVAGISRLRLGAWAGGNAIYDGTFRRVAYLPRAATPAQLQAMTS